MKIVNEKLFIALLLGLLILSSNERIIKAQSPFTIEIKSVSNVDVCGNKLFQIFVQTNEIYAADSIVGYDLYIGYNSEKIQLDQILASNTLSSQLQNSGSEAILTMNKTTPGELWISGAFFVDGKFIKGKQPLIAVTGRYLKDCADTTYISVLDFIPAYFDFSKIPPGIQSTNLTLKAEVANRTDREFVTEIKENKVILTETDSTGFVNVYLTNNDIAKTKKVEFTLYLNKNKHLKIQNIESSQVNLKIDTIERNVDSLIVKANIMGVLSNETPNIKISFSRLDFNSDTLLLVVKVRKLSECNCISTIINDSVEVILQEKQVSVNEQKYQSATDIPMVEIRNTINSFEIRAEESIINHISIFNSIGKLVDNIDCSQSTVEIPSYKLGKGLNILEVVVNYDNKEIKKLIKYIK